MNLEQLTARTYFPMTITYLYKCKAMPKLDNMFSRFVSQAFERWEGMRPRRKKKEIVNCNECFYVSDSPSNQLDKYLTFNFLVDSDCLLIGLYQPPLSEGIAAGVA